MSNKPRFMYKNGNWITADIGYILDMPGDEQAAAISALNREIEKKYGPFKVYTRNEKGERVLVQEMTKISRYAKKKNLKLKKEIEEREREKKMARMWTNKDFIERFGIKAGQNIGEDGAIIWNRCWFHIPEEWGPAIIKLINGIKEKYTVETTDMKHDDPRIEVNIHQIKDKFGELRIYFTPINDKIGKDINQMVDACIGELKKLDPNYGKTRYA